MPLIQFDGPKMTEDQKAALVKKFTCSASEISGIPEQSFMVVIRENTIENFGVGGVLASRMKKG